MQQLLQNMCGPAVLSFPSCTVQAFGVVCAARRVGHTDQLAIKKIANAFGSLVSARRTLREVKLLRLLQHVNVISLIDIMHAPPVERFTDVYLVRQRRRCSACMGC